MPFQQRIGMEGVSLERPAFWQQIIFVHLLSRQGLCSSRDRGSGLIICGTAWQLSL
jgi:hypothetical protein